MFSVPFAGFIEAIALCEEIAEKKMSVTYVDQNRIGEHIRYIDNTRKFQSHDLSWRYTGLSRPLGW